MNIKIETDLDGTVEMTPPQGMTPATREAHGTGLALQSLLNSAVFSKVLEEARDEVVKNPKEVGGIPAFELGMFQVMAGFGFLQAAVFKGAEAVKMREALLAIQKGIDHLTGWVTADLEAVLAVAAELEAADLPLAEGDSIKVITDHEILVGRETPQQSGSYVRKAETVIKVTLRKDFVQVSTGSYGSVERTSPMHPLYDALCDVLGPRLHPSFRMERRFGSEVVEGEQPVTAERVGFGFRLKQRVPEANCAPEVTIMFGTAEERFNDRSGPDVDLSLAGLAFNGDAHSESFMDITRKLVGIAERLCKAEGVTLERDQEPSCLST